LPTSTKTDINNNQVKKEILPSLPAGFLIDLANNNILYANPLIPQIGLPMLTELKRCTFNSTLRIVGTTSPVAGLANVDYIKNNHFKWKENRWTTEVSFEPTTDNLEEFQAKKNLTVARATAIGSMFSIGVSILGEYSIGYGNIDYESSIGYALTQNSLLNEYAKIHNLTIEQAKQELGFDFRERQTKKFMIYAYQQKFLKRISEAKTVAEINTIKDDILQHFWKNGFV